MTSGHIFLLCYGISWLACSFFISGLLYAYMTGCFPTVTNHRDEAGWSICFGMLVGLTSVVGVFIMLLLTGFARFGWKLPGTETSK